MLRDRLRGGPSSRCLFALVLVVGAALSGVGAAGVASASTAHTASASTAHTASGLPGQWENETVDSQGDVGMRASVALNGNGDPHVAYYDKTNKDLKYATRSGGGWGTQTVDATGDVGFYSDLALDGDGDPHVVYYDASNGDLKYAELDGGSWQVQTVDTSGDVGQYASLELDRNGNPHVAYYDASNGDLKYATHNGVSWVPTTVDSGGNVGEYASLALDGDGDPHVAYYDSTNGDLKHAEHDGSWSTTALDTQGNVGEFTDIAVNDSGTAHVSYYDASNGDLKLAEYDGSARVETVDAQGRVGWDTSIVLDDDVAHVSYYDASDSDLRYVREDGSGWVGATPAAGGTTGEFTSLALDDHGNPLVAHYNRTTRDLAVTQGLTVPTAPRSLSATGGNGQVSLSWKAPEYDGRSTVVQYEVYRDDGSGMTKVATVSGTSYTVGGQNGQSYDFVVRAVNAVGQSPKSNQASATPARKPDAPQSLTASAGDEAVSLSWSAPANNGGATIQQYVVYRDDGTGLTKVGTTSSTSYTDTGLTNGDRYDYVVRARNRVGLGPKSNQASATPLGVPDAPQSLTASAGDGEVSLSWSTPASDGGKPVQQYVVYRDDGTGLTQVATVSGTSYTDTGLTNGKQYSYEVAAVTAVGQGPASAAASATPQGVPGAPPSVTAETSEGGVVLSWPAPADDGGSPVTEYRVYRGTDPSNMQRVGTVTATSFEDESVTPGTEYVYVVRAANANGDGPDSAPVTQRFESVPDAPSDVSAAAKDGAVSVEWAAPDDNSARVDHYVVYRLTDDGRDLIGTTEETSFTHADAENGTRYGYVVRAVNEVGEGPTSERVSARPAVPETPTATPTDTAAGSQSPTPDETTETTIDSNGSGPGFGLVAGVLALVSVLVLAALAALRER